MAYVDTTSVCIFTNEECRMHDVMNYKIERIERKCVIYKYIYIYKNCIVSTMKKLSEEKSCRIS
jgi:hypothetical protein